MTIVFTASADIQDLSLWTAVDGAVISNDTARTGTYSYKLQLADYLQCSIASRADYYLKCGVRITAADPNHIWILFRESSTTHVAILFDTDAGSIKAYRDYSGTLLGTSSGVTIATNTWYCVEIYVKIDNSVGVVTIKVNGTEVLALTGKDTQNGGSAAIDNVRFFNEYTTSTFYVDDVVIRDDAFPGTGGLYLLTANGDGSDTAWTASAGARWDCVDEVPPSATDYIWTDAGTPNTKNTSTFSDLGITPGSIASVSVLAKAKLSEAGTGNIRAILKSSASYANGASTALGTSESWAALHTTVDPNGGGAWGQAGVDAISAGVETL